MFEIKRALNPVHPVHFCALIFEFYAFQVQRQKFLMIADREVYIPFQCEIPAFNYIIKVSIRIEIDGLIGSVGHSTFYQIFRFVGLCFVFAITQARIVFNS